MPTNHTTTAHCSERIYRKGEWSVSFCRRPATVTEPDGTIWCTQHAPSRKRAERERRLAEQTRRTTTSERAKAHAEEGIDALVVLLTRAGIDPQVIERMVHHGARAEYRGMASGSPGFTGGVTIDGATMRAITLAIQAEVQS